MPHTPVARLLLLLPFALLAACDGATMANLTTAPGMVPEMPPEMPPGLPPAVAAALPPGTLSALVFVDPAGCYLFSVERTDPPSGYPVRDAAGNQICQPGVSPPVAALTPAPAPGA